MTQSTSTAADTLATTDYGMFWQLQQIAVRAGDKHRDEEIRHTALEDNSDALAVAAGKYIALSDFARLAISHTHAELLDEARSQRAYWDARFSTDRSTGDLGRLFGLDKVIAILDGSHTG